MQKRLIFIGAGIVLALLVVVVTTALLTPESTNPAADNAVLFVQDVLTGNDAEALSLLAPAPAAWVAENCPGGVPSGCIAPTIPDDWGRFERAVFRRGALVGSAWNMDIIGFYEAGVGSTGVCAHTRMEQDASGAWLVAEYAGFIHCGDPASRLMATNPDTPNRVPAASP
ncbi:MAG: hypothetical protein KME04_18720 [Pleurocapsa minor GSE-CHR-MK-17-07R]|jgi:hypothetical protein|nr:hypothetical protein [Pleurocapsa minor GSE-CHR-MK 17-07R]